LIGVLSGVILLFIDKLKNRSLQKSELKNKLKHFKPTIHEGVFSNTISWEERDTPLTDEELKNRY